MNESCSLSSPYNILTIAHLWMQLDFAIRSGNSVVAVDINLLIGTSGSVKFTYQHLALGKELMWIMEIHVKMNLY